MSSPSNGSSDRSTGAETRGTDPFDLERFVTAQASCWGDVVSELRAGRKRTHWMWFVFPQMRGLGLSSTAHHFGIASLAEAKAYLAHPVLGPRLREACSLMLSHRGRTALEVLGSPDHLKLVSSVTLLARAAPGDPLLADMMAAFAGGREDEATLRLLAEAGS